jgi:hypothetical protein
LLQKSKTHSRSDLDTIYEVGKELGVSYPDNFVIDYDSRKKQEAYENRVREERLERRKKLRARKRQTSNWEAAHKSISKIGQIVFYSKASTRIQYAKFNWGCSQSQIRIRLGWQKRVEFNLLLQMMMLKNIWSKL